MQQDAISTDSLIKTIIEKESWEDIIYYIVNVEKIDPWNVDLVKLCNGFIRFIRRATELDFRIPAKIVFVAALLLRLKAERLSLLEEKEEVPKIEKPIEPLDIDVKSLSLSYPIKRLPKRQITLQELISALKKAVEIERKREERRILAKTNLQANIRIEEDVTKRMEELMKEIEEKLARLRTTKVSFKDLLREWKREEIVRKFVPMLHLEKDKKIETEQPELFRDIWIKLKNDLSMKEH